MIGIPSDIYNVISTQEFWRIFRFLEPRQVRCQRANVPRQTYLHQARLPGRMICISVVFPDQWGWLGVLIPTAIGYIIYQPHSLSLLYLNTRTKFLLYHTACIIKQAIQTLTSYVSSHSASSLSTKTAHSAIFCIHVCRASTRSALAPPARREGWIEDVCAHCARHCCLRIFKRAY